ncbi:hypothetical protein [Haloferula sargassicola]|uniref:hypothetical protein n=1 Tax=Haloferula sargassicola TaxID=490096 RepID=UPI00336531CB
MRYRRVSEALYERFWDELEKAIDKVALNPERHHFDSSGYRRCNLGKFPYHLLFEERLDCNRIIVVRHDHRDPRFGLRHR